MHADRENNNINNSSFRSEAYKQGIDINIMKK